MLTFSYVVQFTWLGTAVLENQLQTARWQSIGCDRHLLSSGLARLESSDLSCPVSKTALRGSWSLSLCPMEFVPFSLLSSLSSKTFSQCWLVLFCWHSVLGWAQALVESHTASLPDPMSVNTCYGQGHRLGTCWLGHREGTVTLRLQACDINSALQALDDSYSCYVRED